MTRIWTANFDGGIQGGNPGGLPSYGVVIRNEVGIILELSGVLPSAKKTNNVAEWWAMEMVLVNAWALHTEWDELHIFGDSQLVVKQLAGDYQVNADHLKPFMQICKELVNKMRDWRKIVTIEWSGRDTNKDADKLAGKAYKRYSI